MLSASMSFLHDEYGDSSFDYGSIELLGDKYVDSCHGLQT